MNRHEQDMREIDIAAYLDGRLTTAERERLVQRVVADREEREALTLAESVIRDTGEAGGDVPDSIQRKARGSYPQRPDLVDLVVALIGRAVEVLNVSSGTDVLSAAQMGMVRGRDASAEPLVVAFRSFNRARVYVHVENMGSNRCQFTVQARDPLRDVPLENARADLVSGWRELASNPLEAGTTHFEDVVPGRYDLIVRKNDAVIGRMTIQIAGA